ncbi:MAG: hypothetical protein M1816_004476 [Peltula sp. TS41687]|nr:MAG: hypothetical protein M1816_004476 [Peltula sp. TS41687]
MLRLQLFSRSKESIKLSQNSTLHLTQYGSEPQATYTLRRPDPLLPSSKNCYSIALFDSYNPDILFGEVLVRIEWTQPTLSAAEVRRNGTTVASPEPIIPSDFVIQLYAPDQTIHVKQKAGSWGSSGYWEFELPQHTFRQPSASDLDRSRDDPATTETTPKINFRWKRDGKLSRDLICLLSGKSTDLAGIKKKSGSKEPDIAIALFKHSREITVYEPNLSRVELEDPKGLEVVLLLSAAVIKDVFFGNPKEVFNLSIPTKELANTVDQPNSPISKIPTGIQHLPSSRRRGHSSPNIAIPSQTTYAGQYSSSIPNGSRSPFKGDHNQIEIDRETARLRAQMDEEERAKAQAEEAEVRRIKKMLKAEEKEVRRRQAEVDKESERLKKIYGWEQVQSVKETRKQVSRQQTPSLGQFSAPLPQGPFTSSSRVHTHSVPGHQQGSRIEIWSDPQLSKNRQPETGVQSSLPLRIKQAAAGPGRDMQQPAETRQAAAVVVAAKKKKSIFGLRSRSGDSGNKPKS